MRDMIISDLHSFLDLGASQRVADLLIVLRLFFAEHPEAGYRRVRKGHADLDEDIGDLRRSRCDRVASATEISTNRWDFG